MYIIFKLRNIYSRHVMRDCTLMEIKVQCISLFYFYLVLYECQENIFPSLFEILALPFHALSKTWLQTEF